MFFQPVTTMHMTLSRFRPFFFFLSLAFTPSLWKGISKLRYNSNNNNNNNDKTLNLRKGGKNNNNNNSEKTE